MKMKYYWFLSLKNKIEENKFYVYKWKNLKDTEVIKNIHRRKLPLFENLEFLYNLVKFHLQQ